MKLEIINPIFDNYRIDKSIIFSIIQSIHSYENKIFDSINIIILDDEDLKMMKKQYFNQDFYTDVISFNLEDPGNPIDGEIYISLPRVIDNANTYDSNLNTEFKRIIIHGLLHLVGYIDDTKETKQQMTDLENQYLDINPDIMITSI